MTALVERPPKVRTLIAGRRYFGIDALALQQSAHRAVARIIGLPEGTARISARQLRLDFGVDAQSGEALVTRLVAAGLVRPHPAREGDFEVLPRLAEFAHARVVDPLPREKARRLVDRACRTAEQFNGERSRNPLAILTIAPCGEYLADRDDLSELRIGVIVCERPRERMSRWRAPLPGDVAIAEVRRAIGRLSSFVRVVVSEDVRALPRPFTVAWQDPAL